MPRPVNPGSVTVWVNTIRAGGRSTNSAYPATFEPSTAS